MKSALQEAVERLTQAVNVEDTLHTTFAYKEDIKLILAALCTKNKTEYFYTDAFDEEGFQSIEEIMERLWDDSVEQPFTFNVHQYNCMDKFNVRSLPVEDGSCPTDYEVIRS